MGTYSHLTDLQLVELRDKFTNALNDRLTGPSAQGWADKRVQYDAGAVNELRISLAEVAGEIDRREGRNQRRPIYLV
jgi:hypothetical protein